MLGTSNPAMDKKQSPRAVQTGPRQVLLALLNIKKFTQPILSVACGTHQ